MWRRWACLPRKASYNLQPKVDWQFAECIVLLFLKILGTCTCQLVGLKADSAMDHQHRVELFRVAVASFCGEGQEWSYSMGNPLMRMMVDEAGLGGWALSPKCVE